VIVPFEIKRGCTHCTGPVEDPESWICNACLDDSMAPFIFEEHAAAKSSSMSMVATVCQLCGHKFDGLSAGEPCDCECHKGA
jgi:hypothetical protein